MSWTVSTLACGLWPPVSPAGTPRHPGASLLGGDPRPTPFPPASARSSPQMQIRVAQTFVSEADSFSESSSHFLPLRFAQHFSFQTLGPRFTPLSSAELPGGHRCMRRLRPRSRLGGSSQAGAGVPGQRASAAGGVGTWRAQREARGTHGACRAPWLRWGYSEGTRRGTRRAPDPEFGLSATHACSVWWVYTFTLQ